LNLNVTAAIADVVRFKSTVIVRHAHAAGYHILCAGRLAQTCTVWSVRAYDVIGTNQESNCHALHTEQCRTHAHTNPLLIRDPSRAPCVSVFVTSSPALSNLLCRRRRRS
ncbi:hypothetical protein BGW80DRAFT_1565713, partial [Lactifluus volemus]